MEEKIVKSQEIKGNIDFDGTVIFENSCIVRGNVKAKIISIKYSIKAGGSIEAGGSIKAGGSIEAGGSIKAGGSIEAGGWIFNFSFSLSATFIVTKTLPFWRNFWAEMSPLKKWRKEILNNDRCWNDYKDMLSKEEAEKICKWEGWHWILRAHLEMFFGLKEKYVIKK